MPCNICQHPQAAAIAAAVSRGDSLRRVAARYGVGKSTLARHLSQCPSRVPVAPQAIPMVTMGESVPAYLVNAQVHHELTQIYLALNNPSYLVDARRGLLEVVARLLQVVRDDTENDRATG